MPADDQQQQVRTRTLSWEELVRKAWGKDFNKQETAYEFSSGRKYEDPVNGGPYGDQD